MYRRRVPPILDTSPTQWRNLSGGRMKAEKGIVVSWRFRKTFKVIPGVKLDLTSRGLSATFGVAPFSVNVGPRGVYRNISIPGTGIWDRQRIGGPSSQSPDSRLLPSAEAPGIPFISPVPPSVLPPPGTEIHSASTELLTSESLEQLRRVLTDAYNERDELSREISSATTEASTATRRYQSWERGFLLKRLFKQSFATRKEAAETATAKLEELHEQLRLTTIATEIAVDREQAEPYYRMRDTFAALSECQKVWNVLTEKAIDRVAERSNANTAVTRTPVHFSLNSCDLIQWEQKVPHLPNRTGGDMYIYPGFVLYRSAKQAFALIDSRDVTLRFVSTQFTETDPVPSDSQIVGRTWAKCNKDGSPDRRFRDNCQILVAHYGTLLFGSRDGLDVRYICSNARLAEEFAKAWMGFQRSFQCGPVEQGELTPVLAGAPDKCCPTFERLRLASSRFVSAHQKFWNTVSPVLRGITDGERGPQTIRFSDEEFESYMANVVELITAAKEAVSKAAMVPQSERERFRNAIRELENSWNVFLPGSDHRINGDGLIPFVQSALAFEQAYVDFGETALRICKGLGVPLP